ncbi:MAG TPA: response regulator transcription factor [Acidimicrobiales bacterium]|nr:response regulator transcription factor [Acidimicrobiales bacterium]
MGTENNQGGARILVVDDDPTVRALLSRYLQLEGYEVSEAGDGATALNSIKEHPPDLVLLDRVLPGEDGLDVLARLRRENDVPVILLTGLGDEGERILGLKLGADDYVVKPFSPAEIAARISTVLRRVKPDEPSSRLDFDGLALDLGSREVLVHGDTVDTTHKEFDLLAFLASSPRQVFSREQLLDHVWGSSSEWQDPATVTEHIRRVRRRIESDPDNPRWIKTIRGVGYRFEP